MQCSFRLCIAVSVTLQNVKAAKAFNERRTEASLALKMENILSLMHLSALAPESLQLKWTRPSPEAW
eukprot:Skav222291  [mRNA]  locus=scaffold4688:48474:50851:+ [translate_table: standard]